MARQGAGSTFVVKELKTGIVVGGIARLKTMSSRETVYLFRIRLLWPKNITYPGKLLSWFSLLNGRRKFIGILSTQREHAVSLLLFLKLLIRYIWARRLAAFGPSTCWKIPLKPPKVQWRIAKRKLGVCGPMVLYTCSLTWRVKSTNVQPRTH